MFAKGFNSLSAGETEHLKRGHDRNVSVNMLIQVVILMRKVKVWFEYISNFLLDKILN